MSGRINKPDTPADIELRKCLAAKNSFVIVAGAGSGKTTSLIKALKYIDDTEGKTLRQQGKKIACITYTTVAEKEILDDVGHDPFFRVSTIHSFLWELLRPFQKDIKIWVKAKIKSKLEEFEIDRQNFSNRTRQTTRENNARDTARYMYIDANIDNVPSFTYETGSNYLEGILGHSDIISMGPSLITASPLLQIILASRFPYFFIDESQDTIGEFVDAMKQVEHNVEDFCLGFFGDPMQKIYHTGSGAITLEKGWQEIQKPENFRCSTSVLRTINNIRAAGDNLQQNGGRVELIEGNPLPVEGSAQIFIMQADDRRAAKLAKVREYLSIQLADPLWVSDEKIADVKVLVIEHRIAATRLGFPALYSIFKDGTTDSLSMSFSEGSNWALLPFQRYILPLVSAFRDRKDFLVVELLKKYCPIMQKSYLSAPENEPLVILREIKTHLGELNNLLSDTSNATVVDVLNYLNEYGLISLDERISTRIGDAPEIEADDEDVTITDRVIAAYLNCPVKEVWGYSIYINEESPFSTQHGIKGDEFMRVVVILDDEEGRRSSSYSYEKLLGIKDLSDRDNSNLDAGQETTLDRTRRLLYVCCSRSLKDLAVILFAADIQAATEAVLATGIFHPQDVKNETTIDIALAN
nr:UvrD-helicase domain-containing protein [uncultured Flavobacterium sp.]